MLDIPMCYNCKHFRSGEAFNCDAFPDGIPASIVNSETDHRKPVAGDGGIQYEPINPNVKVGPFDEPVADVRP